MRGKKIVLSLAVLGGLGGAGLWRSWYERGHFVTEEVRIPSKKIKEPKTLVFLTDLHDKEFGRGAAFCHRGLGAGYGFNRRGHHDCKARKGSA